MNLGPTELIIILAIVLLLFGSRKLPDLARSLGKSSREFKKGLQEAEQEPDEADAVPPATPEASATDPANPAPPEGAATDGQTPRPEDRTGS